MSPQRVPAGVLAWLAFLPHVIAAEPLAAPGRDRYGDPLPPGVIARLGTERLTLGWAGSLTFSPDGRYLAAASTMRPAGIRVWEVSSGREVLRMRHPFADRPGFTLTSLAFSPDGKAVALACSDNAVRLWEVATGKELNHCDGLPGPALHLTFGPDGLLFFACLDGAARCWDRARPGPPRTFGGLERVEFLAVSRDGKTLLAAGGRKPPDWKGLTFVRWDIASGKEIGRASPARGTGAFSLSPDGGAMAVLEADRKSIAVLDPLTGRERARAGGADRPRLPIFSADGKTMAAANRDGAVLVWDVGTGKLRARLKAPPTGLDALALSPDGKVVALTSCMTDAAIRLWDVATVRELHAFPGHRGGPLTVAFVGDGREVATVNRIPGFQRPAPKWGDWFLCRWDAASGALRAAVRCRPQGETHMTAFSADGRRVVTVLHDGTWHLWDVEAGKELRDWKVPYAPPSYSTTGKYMLAPPAFSPDHRVLLAGTGRTIDRWEVGTGKELSPFSFEVGARGHACCVTSPDGEALAVTGGDGVALLSASDGKVRHRLKAVGAGWPPPAFSPDGRTLAVPERGGVSLWEVASGRPRGRLAAGPPVAFSLAFSPAGRLLAGGGEEESVSVWDLASGAVVGRLRANLGRVDSLSFSPGGTRLALAGSSPVALVCDVAGLCGKKDLGQLLRLSPPSAEELEGLWADLAGADGARAYRAVLRLGAAGPKATALLKRRLKGGAAPGEARIVRLIADLDSDNFATREKATTALEALGAKAAPALRRAAEQAASAEVRARAGRLLKRMDVPKEAPPTPELVRLRAVEALEANATPEAGAVLEELAAGLAADSVTGEAKASLQRLARRAGPPDTHDGRRSR